MNDTKEVPNIDIMFRNKRANNCLQNICGVLLWGQLSSEYMRVRFFCGETRYVDNVQETKHKYILGFQEDNP